jgi:HAD superfamily hydrolase (TIGR01484 family)
MTYQVLATDYNGTLATDGQVDETTLSALKRWRQQGRKLILITGRRLDDVQRVFAHLDWFDWVVAENGPVLYQPSSQQERLLADPPPEEFLRVLSDRISHAENLPEQPLSREFARLRKDSLLTVGRVIMATWEPHGETAIATIQDLGLDLQVIRNKGAVMILPSGVDKALGLRAVAQELHLSLDQIVGVGDAENDLAFLQLCGYSVAVANALPTIKEQVNWVTTQSRGAGVSELIDQLLRQD